MELGGVSTGANGDPEAASLLQPSKEMLRYYEKTQRTSRIMMIGVLCTLFVATAVFVALGATVWRVNTQMEQMRVSLAPHAEQVINSTMQMLADTKDTLHNLNKVSTSGTQLATASVPNLVAVSNHTASISERIAELLRHPELKLSLGG
tara:strand:+ start:737 stop:1183 length:447 start_codon:yes stop_codon:yes gene_type:complete